MFVNADSKQNDFYSSCDSRGSGSDYQALLSATSMSADWRNFPLDSFAPFGSETGSASSSDHLLHQIHSGPRRFSTDTSSQTSHARQSVTTELPSIMAPLLYSEAAINTHLSMPAVRYKDTYIAPSYIRSRESRKKLAKTYMAREHATHQVIFFSPPREFPTPKQREEEGELLMYPVHEYVMASQSNTWHLLQPEARPLQGTKVVKMAVDHLESMDDLFTYLHTHDEEQLYTALQKEWDGGSLDGEVWMRGFIANIVCCGIFDDRLRGVIWAVVDPTTRETSEHE